MLPQTNQIKREGEEKIRRAHERQSDNIFEGLINSCKRRCQGQIRRQIQRFKMVKLPITSRIFPKYSDDSEQSHPNKNIALYFPGNETEESPYL
jgi:hypothetical protein